jgi:hypothetical protein
MANVYFSFAQIGHCRVCGKEDDLRFAVCFDCCDFVDGEELKHRVTGEVVHRLWDRRNPKNQWFVSECN